MSVERRSGQNNYLDGGDIETDLFDLQPNKRFGVGIFDSSSIVNYKPGSIEEAYLKFRANVYIDEAGILDNNEKRSDGTELDSDDERSAHIIAFENKIGALAIIGCMRLLEKNENHYNPLPIEIFFPEIFSDPLPIGSKESSRFIVSYKNIAMKSLIKRRILISSVAYTSLDTNNPVYAVVEDNLKRDLAIFGVPLEEIGPKKMIEKYHSINYPIKINQHEFANRLGKEAISQIDTDFGSISYFGNIKANK